MGEDLARSLTAELATDLARAIESMTSEQPRLTPGGDMPPSGGGIAFWRQAFTAGHGTAWLAAPELSWISLGLRTLRAAGIEDGGDDTSKSTFIEILGQAFSMLARSLSGRTNSEWNCAEGEERREAPESVAWTSLQLGFADGVSECVYIGFDPELLVELGGSPPNAIALTGNIPNPQPAPVPPAITSKTLELLLDVELPVSVSFGRAQLALKDVIKLTSGTIVELNRAITEPVEVIVNNCVIARGEVVVVEGNYGVRIQQVVSREERLRTLY